MKPKGNTKPLIFACAGCSRAGQVAYSLALAIDRVGLAEMSCLTGLAAQKPSFLRRAKARRIITIDGCPTECSKSLLDQLDLKVHQHIKLKELGVEKHTADVEQVRMLELVSKLLQNRDEEI
jgi:uncharacterized metal-binding protein